MFKLFLGLVILAFSTYMGYRQSLRYKHREQYFYDFLSFNQLLESEIGYCKNSIPDIIKKTGYKSGFSKTLEEFGSNLGSSRQISPQDILKEDEIKIVENYLDNIGKSDVKSQMEFLSSSKGSLKKLYDESREENKRYSGLYLKLGFLIGLAVFIIII